VRCCCVFVKNSYIEKKNLLNSGLDIFGVYSYTKV
jgi:hypothetical protein